MSKFSKYLEEAKEVISPEQVELRSKVSKHLDHLKAKAVEIWPGLAKTYQFKNIKLEFTADLGDAMAQAYVSRNAIEIELDSLAKHTERMFNEVIGHELCHLIVPLIHKGVDFDGKDAHRVEWQEVMKKMNFAVDLKDLED